MARYIDADNLIEQVGSLEQLARKRVYDTPTNSPIYEMYSTQYIERERMLCIIKANPTADVVPRAEVDRLRELNNSLLEAGQEWQKRYENLAREIFEEIDSVVELAEIEWGTIFGVKMAIAELKSKYAEGEK